MLPDVLRNNLKIVFCGTAAGDRSARLQMYYAGPGNKFWKVLHEVGLTPRVLAPSEYVDLPQYSLGLTDLVKDASGVDDSIDFTNEGTETLRDKIIRLQPRVLCFNGKRAAQEFLSRSVSYGVQPEQIGTTRIFVAPSTSGAANGFWNIEWWRELAKLVHRDGLSGSLPNKPSE